MRLLSQLFLFIVMLAQNALPIQQRSSGSQRRSQRYKSLRHSRQSQEAIPGKWKTYILTFLAYVALHSMRMTYSQIKPDFQSAYHHSNLFLGVFDALIYISTGLGYFFRYYIQGKTDIMQSYFIFMLIASSAYLMLPLSSLILGDSARLNIFSNIFIPGFGLLLFGFCQFPAWPTLLTLTNEYFDLQTEGQALGFWSANANFGNIVGFGMTGLLVNEFSFSWELPMIFASGFSIVMTFLVFFFVQEKQIGQENIFDEELLEKQVKKKSQTGSKSQYFNQFLSFCKKLLTKTQNRLYIVSMALIKSVLYSYLLWMPTYLDHQGLRHHKATIPIAFNIGTLLGSFLLGRLYQIPQDEDQISSFKRHIGKYALFYSCLVIIGLLLTFFFISVNVLAYYILSFFSGAFLGGCYNMLASNQVISIVDGKKEDLKKLSTLSMAVGNTVVGILELFIGVALDLKNDKAGEKKFFFILVTVSTIALVILLWRSKIMEPKHKQDE